MTFAEKIKEFYLSMKESGYNVRLDEFSVHPYDYNMLTHIVTKDNFYHVGISEKLIVEAPLEYCIGLVEHEFNKLEENETK